MNTTHSNRYLPLFIALLIAVFLFFPIAYGQSETVNETGANPVFAPGKLIYFHKYFSGKIHDKFAFSMDLINRHGELSGNYRYDGREDSLYLSGTINPDASFTMIEKDASGHASGSFTGKLSSNGISGTWQSIDGGKIWPFVATQTREIVVGTKKEILTQAIGRYPLKSISGWGGASGMWDTWREGGQWESNISATSGGQREASFIKLKKSDIRLLDNMVIIIDRDLTMRLMVAGKAVITIPYLENSMRYAVAEPEEGPGALSARTTVVDDMLYLMKQDGVDYQATLSGNFEAVVSGTLIIYYSLADHSFNVSFNNGGESTFKFLPP